MTLGRGLESLIPKKSSSSDQAPELNQIKPGSEEEISSSLKPNQGSGQNIPTAENQDELTKGQINSPDWSEQRGPKGGKFSSHRDSIFHIEIDKIKPNPHQPRRDFNEETLKELALSIREFGILQPLVASKIEHETESGTEVEYQLIAGERRLMAAKMLVWERVPVIIRKISQGSEQLEMAVIENLQRANLNPIETARAYAKLQDEFGLTQREIAAKLGKSRETIANTLRLLNLPTEIQEALSKNQINESQARLLLAIPDLTEQQIILNDLLAHNLSVRELKVRIRKANKQPQETENQPQIAVDPEIYSLQEQLTELLGAQVRIDPPRLDGESRLGKTDKSGKIIITFYSPEEIQGIINKLTNDTNV